MEHVQKIEVSDLAAIEISCECGATLTLTLGGQYPSLGEELPVRFMPETALARRQ